MLKRSTILTVLVLGALFAFAAGASAEAPPEEEAGSTAANPYLSPLGLAVPSSNGYGLSVNPGKGHRVEVDASGAAGSVTYSVPGSISEAGIHADLGKYGRIDMHWVPSGHVQEVRFKCRYKGLVRHFYETGSYVGALRFRGGGGFTAVSLNRVAWSRSWYSAAGACGFSLSTAEPGAGVVIEAGARDKRSTPAHLFVYRPHSGAKVEYSAHSEQEKGRIEIRRHAFAEGGPHSLTLTAANGTATATISPPAPFYGGATFERPKGSKGTLTGELGVEFPDGTKANLAGRAFEATLHLESINVNPG